jgi:hypothetical protein
MGESIFRIKTEEISIEKLTLLLYLMEEISCFSSEDIGFKNLG